jgi:hypothetical protein
LRACSMSSSSMISVVLMCINMPIGCIRCNRVDQMLRCTWDGWWVGESKTPMSPCARPPTWHDACPRRGNCDGALSDSPDINKTKGMSR